MSDTVKARQPLLRRSLVPTRAVIRNRMADRFGGAALLMRDLVEPCAEEAERLLFDLVNQLGRAPEHMVAVEMVKTPDSHRYKKMGYRCPICSWHDITLHDRFCAGCGGPIQWIGSPSKEATPPAESSSDNNTTTEKE